MSNINVGAIYQQVMKDVIESSRVDFEEGGVDESVLEELRAGWQQKLSALSIAQFPWDPKPEPPPAPVNTAQSIPPNMNYQRQDMNTPPTNMPQPNLALPNMNLPQLPQINNGAPQIKAEPGTEANGITAPPQTFVPPPVQQRAPPGMTAQERAAFNLQHTYGNRASASINALQSAMPQGQQPKTENGQGQPPMQAPQGAPQGQRPQMTQAQYNQAMARQAQAQRNLHGNPGSGNVSKSQTDGAADETIGILSGVNSNGELVEMGRIEIDNLIRKRIEANGRAMEGGGLMLPLKKHTPSGRDKERKSVPGNKDYSEYVSAQTSAPRAQVDGADSDDDLKEEADEDAINSDLDDPDDDALNDDEDEDGDMGNVMLCMYDKVQRVKNKWKCVMKDGVITINGKEYVFHKASGEYEW